MKRQTTVLGIEQEEDSQAEQYTTTTTSSNTDNTADSLFAKALTNLSFNDRTAIEDEIHGVSCMAIEETPDLLEHSLIDFELELHKISPKPAYDKAQELLLASTTSSSHLFSVQKSSLSCCYINRKTFRLRFLRCELFNVRKAAERFIRYLDFVAKVYGDYALQRPIRMSDFSSEEMLFLREGKTQILPYRDRSGRRIIVFPSTNQLDVVPEQSMLKVGFYLLDACAGGCDTANNDFNNIECHRKGLIIISFVHLNNSDDDASKLNLKLIKGKISAQMMVAGAVPIRMVGNHLCYPNTQAYRVRGKIVGMANSVLNSRTKIHLGNPIEWRYALQAYGIPTEIIPSTDTGTIKLVNWKRWIKLKNYTECLTQERMIEQMTVSMKTLMRSPMNSIVECPGSNDVVFRRGKSMNYHPGNAKFQNIIESKLQHYSDPNTKQAQKKAIEIEVIQHVKKDGGRFLKWENDKSCWIDMNVQMCEDMDSNIDIDIRNMTTINYIPANSNANKIENTNSNTNMNTNANEVENMNVNTNVNMNVNSAIYFDAYKEIQSKVNSAFVDFKRRMIRAQQKQQQQQVNTSSTHAFERQDGQKRQRSSSSNTTITTTVVSNAGSDSDRSVSNMNGGGCGYFFCDVNDKSSIDNIFNN